jgi:hypothetical protein
VNGVFHFGALSVAGQQIRINSPCDSSVNNVSQVIMASPDALP